VSLGYEVSEASQALPDLKGRLVIEASPELSAQAVHQVSQGREVSEASQGLLDLKGRSVIEAIQGSQDRRGLSG
jgi:hypothetical protein